MRCPLRHLLRALCLLGVLHVWPAFAAMPAEITSDAGAEFVYEGGVEKVFIRSETVQVVVDLPPDFVLMDEQTRRVTRGQSALLAHRVANNGPRPILLRLMARNRDASEFVPEAVHVYSDTNRNGEIDAEDFEITEADSVPLGGYSSMALLVRFQAPASVLAPKTAWLDVMAREVITGQQQMRVDTVELDEPAVIGLFIEKKPHRTEVEIGDIVDYTINIKNITEQGISFVQLLDALPLGFSFLPGSLRIDGVRRDNPSGGAAQLLFELGELAPGATISLTYSTRIGAAALTGNGTSQARASAIGFASNIASAAVRIREGVFSTRGVIIGRVFTDLNGNGLADGGEPGVPGVRVFMEDGTSALTDADGKYSFYGLSPRTHVLKVDTTTLPGGAKLAVTSNENAGDGGSQFASVKRYEMHKSNFAVVPLLVDTLSEIEARQTAARRPHSEISRELSGRLTTDGLPTPVADPKALPSSGVIAAGDAAPVLAPMAMAPSAPTTESAPLKEVAAVRPVSEIDPLVSITDNALGFLLLQEGAVLPEAQTDVWVKGPAGARFTLAVNGEIIADSQVGTKVTAADRNAEAWKFVGVNLNPGPNRLRVTLVDPFGNARGDAIINVLAPGVLATIKVTPPERAVVADASIPAPITVELQDARGLPVTVRTPLTLDATRGQWMVEDLDPVTPGTQVFVQGGQATFPLTPALESGEGMVRVTSGTVHGESTLLFHPHLRPLLAVGVIEGTLHFGERGRGAIFPTGARDAFEQELRTLSASSGDGRLAGGSRAAFFLKGKVRGDYLLTASFDSDKAERDRLFRDIQPGEFYPVYGDASERSYDAQSTGRLYVRIDHQKSYLLLGDFTTATSNPSTDNPTSLGNYQRSLNGAKEHFETDRIAANIWVSQDSTRQIVREIPTNGTSGPYQFFASEMVPNSERVEMLVRDRNQPSNILERRMLVRFSDYEFEPISGRLLLRAPAPSLDSNLNPISLRITSEVDQGGAKFWVVGGDARVKLTSQMEVGGAYAKDQNPLDGSSLISNDVTYRFSEQTRLTGEIARSDSLAMGLGWAERLDFKHDGERLKAHAYLGRTQASFRNAGAPLLPGRVEGGLRLNYKLTPTTSLLTQGLVSESIVNGSQLFGVRTDVERAFGAWRVAVGARHSQQTASATSDEVVTDSVRTKVTAPIYGLTGTTAFGEYERSVRDSRELAAVGFDRAFKSGGKMYARHEFITSLDGPFELDSSQRRHTTVFGLERAYMQDGQMFNEYRADNEVFGREAEASSGLRNLWKIADGVRANTSFERITPLAGTGRNAATSLTGSIDYAVDPAWRANARLEGRTSPATDSFLSTLGYARLLDHDWTFLGKSILLVTRSKGTDTGESLQSRAQVGLAWRPTHVDRWNALGKYEIKFESDNRALATFSRRTTHLISSDVNYQPSARWIFGTHYAGKWVGEDRSGYQGGTIAHVIGERIVYTPNRLWDIGLNMNTLFGGDVSQGRFAIGPEVGLLLARNLNIGVGYNFVGFRDDDFAADGSTAQGAFIRLRFKYDETLLLGRNPRSN